MANGTAANVKSGVGWLYAAPLGTSEPVDCSTALPSTWVCLGYTDGGIEISENVTIEALEVDQEGQPIDYQTTKIETSVKVKLAEVTRRVYGVAIGLGAGQANTPAKITRGVFGAELAVMLVHDRMETPDNTNIRDLIRSGLSSGDVTRAFAKAPAKTLIPIEFLCSKTAAGNAIDVFPNASGQVG